MSTLELLFPPPTTEETNANHHHPEDKVLLSVPDALPQIAETESILPQIDETESILPPPEEMEVSSELALEKVEPISEETFAKPMILEFLENVASALFEKPVEEQTAPPPVLLDEDSNEEKVCPIQEKRVVPQEEEEIVILNQMRSETSFEDILNNGPKKTILKYNQQPKFKLRYGTDFTHSFSLLEPITLSELTNIFVSHPTLRFASFHKGLVPYLQKSDFHDRICLTHLKKITLQIPEEHQESSFINKDAIPAEFKRLLHVLKEIHFEQLEGIRLVCDQLTAIRLPFSSAFIPTYEMEDNSDPLIHLIRKNQETLQTIVIGPNMSEMVIKMNPKLCNKQICEPRHYPKIESFKAFSQLPMLPSWSAMLRPQRHLTTLSVTLSHEEVWMDVCQAIKSSQDYLQFFSLNLVPIEADCSVIVDFKSLSCCNCLTHFTINFKDCNAIGWGSLPSTITTLNFLGGALTISNVEAMTKQLTQLKEVNVHISDAIKFSVSQLEATKPLFDIVQHPTFNFIKDPNETLHVYNVELGTGVALDWNAVKFAVASQEEFKLIEHSDGDLTLERVLPQVDPLAPETKNEAEEGYSFFAPCFSLLGMQTRN